MIDTTITAEQINLNGQAYLRVKRGPYLLGHYPSVASLVRALPGLGIELADINLKGSTP